MRAEHGLAFAGGAGGALDRAAALRSDAGALAARLSEAGTVLLPVWRGRPLFAAGGERLAWLEPGHPVVAGLDPLFLGLVEGQARFAVDMSPWQPADDAPELPGSGFDRSEQGHPGLPADLRFAELRAKMALLDPLEQELAATARALLTWHGNHGFCSACGNASAIAEGGWQRRCPACGAQHFPRTDPVAIMLVTQGNRTLLGRSPGWPEGMYSCLAGFMEPGETLEAAVRREVAEETGVAIGAVRYVASQPWPFPASLMLGCHAEALDDTIRIDPVEIEDALWLTREDLAQVMTGDHPAIRAPRHGPIAGHLMRLWLADRLV
ncbi:NAD(+) diphosphatase [Frigidibacter oleivorans]|uniref:NAD(+) diphosphatase n=1 Tax=Frigidibacter oleivorans TaxID=2487129 RepID=UPI000F8D0B0A|nr:NAD(+) diphosphatase [Frigidibacter oleivorans]